MPKKETLIRVPHDFADRSNRFRLETTRVFAPQYAQIYHERLETMKVRVQEAATRKWGKDFMLSLSMAMLMFTADLMVLRRFHEQSRAFSKAQRPCRGSACLYYWDHLQGNGEKAKYPQGIL